MIELNPTRFPCPQCRAQPGKDCRGKLKSYEVWHSQRRRLALIALPDEAKAAIHNQWCPRCKVEKGPCEGSDGSWWHRAREYGVLGTPEPKSRQVKILMTPCPDPYCGAGPGERCWTRDKKTSHGKLVNIEARPRQHFHTERVDEADPPKQRLTKGDVLAVPCPVCHAKPGQMCFRRYEKVGERLVPIPIGKWPEAKTMHPDRWNIARQMKEAGNVK